LADYRAHALNLGIIDLLKLTCLEPNAAVSVAVKRSKQNLSFPRKRESIASIRFWPPAFAGMTV